jgi:hypothetical protein
MTFLVLTLVAAAGLPSGLASPGAEPRAIQIQRLAHYCDWHVKCATGPDCDSWRYASTIPLRKDAQPGIGYSADDPSIIRAHNREMSASGIIPLLSWWGPDVPAGGDAFLDAYLSQWEPEAPVRAGLLYEVVGRLRMTGELVDFSDPENAERFISDVRYLHQRYWSRYPDRFYRIDGRPVLFIWLSHAFRGPFEEVAARARREVPFYLIGSDFNVPASFRPGLESVVRGLDAVSAYGIYSPPQATRHGGQVTDEYIEEYDVAAGDWSRWLSTNAPGTSLILPLQFAFDDHLVVPPRNHPSITSTASAAVKLAKTAEWQIARSQLACGNIQPFVLFVSYNEHFEGTAAEPSDRYGTDWLDVLRTTFVVPVLRPAECR